MFILHVTYNVHKMIPISDINPAKNTPVISRIFIITVALVYLLLQPKNSYDLFNFFYEFAAIPCELFLKTPISGTQFYANDCNLLGNDLVFPEKNLYISILFSNFFHANFLHILGNLWSFWIFGNNVEDKLGKFNFSMFLLIIGILSIGVHTILNFNSLVPVVGASGVVSGIMGAYVYLFPNAKLLVLVPFGILFPTTIKARTFMYFWFISQLFIALGSSNISWEAHIGGFLFGYLTIKLSKYTRYNI